MEVTYFVLRVDLLLFACSVASVNFENNHTLHRSSLSYFIDTVVVFS